MKASPEQYRAAEACKMAEVAPYVLRYWETEFPALSEGREKSGNRLYSARDVRIISRIRELLYDEGFTVAGAKKRLDGEIREGRFDDGQTAPSISEQRKPSAKPAAATLATGGASGARRAASSGVPEAPAFLSEDQPGRTVPVSGIPERRKVIAELKEIVRLLDRSRRKT